MSCKCKMIRVSGRKPRESGPGRKHPLYELYINIRRRCGARELSRKQAPYANVTISKEWSESFGKFLSDMGDRPSEAHSIDRIDGKRGYCRHNCRWATPYLQSLNRECTKKKWNWPLGLDRHHKSKYFRYRRIVSGKEVQLGSFKTLSTAIQAALIFEYFEKSRGIEFAVSEFNKMRSQRAILM